MAPDTAACWGCADGVAIYRGKRTAHTFCQRCADHYGEDVGPLDWQPGDD